MITFENNIFTLNGKNTSYIMALDETKRLFHFYYGKKLNKLATKPAPRLPHNWCIKDADYAVVGSNNTPESFDGHVCCIDNQMMEYPASGHLDFRNAAYEVENEATSTISDIKYKSHKVVDGKPTLEGLPAVYDNNGTAKTLIITMEDSVSGLEIELLYTVFADNDILCRSARYKNTSNKSLQINSAYSTSVDFSGNNYDFIYLEGRWSKERTIVRNPVSVGKFEVASNRGGSSHQMNPFVVLCSKDATETAGEVWGFNLVYSGNHNTTLEVDQFKNTRVQMGINPNGFKWDLEPNTTFQTPECIMCYSANGLAQMSHSYHDIIRNNIVRGEYKYKERPILINNWEATYFDFDEEKIMNIANKANEAGIELFVLDDGWFGKRDIDTCSLGDWYVNEAKLPSGIGKIAEKINAIGMGFGLWFEPEMVNPDSDLYRAHPDWAIQSKGYNPAQGRNQLVLDLANKDVCEYLIKAVGDVLASANITYVKWDMNRHMADMPYKGYNHKYILGLYYILESLTSAFPHVLFEGCSGGGGRNDCGMMYYMPQNWCSDNTDAIERSSIQYGTSLCYPLSTTCAHVTTVPNHITERVTPLATRFSVALSGNFGYELDITSVSDKEFEIMKQQVMICKNVRNLMHEGDFYRLQSPFDGNTCAWQIVAKDKSETIACFTRIASVPNASANNLKLMGLEADAKYEDEATGQVYFGDQLMYMGVNYNFPAGDYISIIKKYRKI